jgi:N-hydroxyarylamine O-acetyltransferase
MATHRSRRLSVAPDRITVMTVPSLPADLRDRYLRHLGLDGQLGPPGPDALRLLHHAQLDRVPYENIEIRLGRRTTVDPIESAERIVTGRDGYCFHLNGAFAALPASLGYRLTVIRGAVPDAGDGSSRGGHLVLLVDADDAAWVADVGLGDGFRDPVVLEPGAVDQFPIHYRLTHQAGPYRRFHHDRARPDWPGRAVAAHLHRPSGVGPDRAAMTEGFQWTSRPLIGY